MLYRLFSEDDYRQFLYLQDEDEDTVSSNKFQMVLNKIFNSIYIILY